MLATDQPAGPRGRILASLATLTDRTATRPLDYMRWLPAQLAFLSSTDQITLLRTGNQSQGKTTVGLSECIYRAIGRHPYKRVAPPPIEIWIITASWSQSVAIQTKLWALLPKDEIHPDTVYDPVRGFRGKNPAVRFRNGSIIRIKTTGQGGLNLASATIGYALFDEPPDRARIFGEVQKRVQRAGGHIGLTLTPVNADVEWLRELVDDGKVRDLHFRLEPENLIFAGTDEPICLDDGTVCDTAWIAEIEESGLSWEVPVVVHGEWEFRAIDRVFESFSPDAHVVPDLLTSDVGPSGEVTVCVGIDYGEERLRTSARLMLVDESGDHPRVYIVGEYDPSGASTVDMDAEAILGMLAATGIRWSDVDYAWGDKRYTDRKGRITKKTNRLLLESMARSMGVVDGLRPIIRGAKRGPGAGRGSVWRGVRWLNDAMIRPGHFYVDARCTRTIECLLKWDGTDRSEYKDAIDAIRYGLRHLILARRRIVPGIARR